MTALILGITVFVTFAIALWLPGLAFRLRPKHALSQDGPNFDIRAHLSGPLTSEGVIYGPMGRVTSRFVAEMRGIWYEDSGRLQEAFQFASGETQAREWQMTVAENGKVTASAHDIIGLAEGWQSGAAMCLTYRIQLEQSSGRHILTVTDWMYLMENGTIMNHSQMRKFGIKVAELIATIRPAEA